MPNYRHKPNLTLLAIAQPIKDAFLEDLENYFPVIDALNQSYHAERTLQIANLNTGYTHASLCIRLRIRTQKIGDFPKPELIWVRGSGNANTQAAKEKTGRTFPFTKALHHCGADGAYTNANIRMMMARRSKWEIDLTIAYERRLAPLREYLAHMQAVYVALRRHAPPPVIEIPR